MRTPQAWLRQQLPAVATMALAPVAELLTLWHPARSMPWSAYDYERVWVAPDGHDYRHAAYERQRAGGSQPLLTNPTPDEARHTLRSLAPLAVLEVGCGWGRMLEQLRGEDFALSGCDVSAEMLSLCPPDIPTFPLDIAVDSVYCAAHAGAWDVLFVHGVLMYCMANPAHMRAALRNLHTLAGRAVLVWEWPEVCVQMRRINRSPKFRYHPIAHHDG